MHPETESGKLGRDLLIAFADRNVISGNRFVDDRGQQFIRSDSRIRQLRCIGNRLRHVDVEDLRASVQQRRRIVADEHFTGISNFRLAFAHEEIKITGVPFRIEVIETGPFRSVSAVRHIAARVKCRPVVAHTPADREKICAFIVLPGLEINTHLVIVLRGDFHDLDFQADLRDGDIIFRKHSCDVVARIIGNVENQPVQIGIISHKILSLPDFRYVSDVHANVLDQRHQVFRGDEFRKIEEYLCSVVRPHLRLVHEFDDGIDSHAAFMIFETVFFRTDNQEPGPVHVFQTLHRGIASELESRIVTRLCRCRSCQHGAAHGCRDGCRRLRSDPCSGSAPVVDSIPRIRLLHTGVADTFRLNHLPYVVAEFIGVHVFQQVSFRHDARVVVVADEMDHFRILFHRYKKLCLDSCAVISACVLEI